MGYENVYIYMSSGYMLHIQIKLGASQFDHYMYKKRNNSFS